MPVKQQSPLWPYLGILICLFVLSVTAPRAWQRTNVEKQGIIEPVDDFAQSFRERIERAEYDAVELPQIGPQAGVELPSFNQPEEVEIYSPPAVELALPTPQVVEPEPPFASALREAIDAASLPTKLEPRPDMKLSIEPASPPEEEPQDVRGGWPLPRVLLEQLEALSLEESDRWAGQAIEAIHELCARESTAVTTELVARLKRIAERANSKPAQDSQAEGLRIRAQYALQRWIDIWEPTARLEDATQTESQKDGRDAMALSLADVDSLTRSGAAGGPWRDYLLLSELNRLAANREQLTEERRRAARKVLARLNPNRLSASQQQFTALAPLAKLQEELRAWAARPVESDQLLAQLERYERSGLASDAKTVADNLLSLGWSNPVDAKTLADNLQSHYRNANLRLAFSRELLNRLLPQPETIEGTIRDTVVNVPTFGRSTTFTKLSVRLVPDPNRIRVGLEASGLVSSDTVSNSGPATFYNNGSSTFLVRKLMVLGPKGLSVWPAVAEAENNHTSLVMLETDFDSMPLVGSLVRSIAQSKHEDARGQARMEVEQKVASRAREQLDAEIRPRLVKAAEMIQTQQLAAIDRMGLELVPVGLSTTEDRAVARLRLATTMQLGAHTPRPRALSDAWFSLQVHQSAINNVLEQLDLGGRKFTITELFDWVAGKLNQPDLAQQEDLPEDVEITFADSDPIRVQCNGGQVEVTFAIHDLKQGSKRWHDFTVRAIYAPQPEKLDPKLGRDGNISLEGATVNGKLQVALRAIFSKALSRNRDLSLLGKSLTSDPRFSNLEISQFTIEDGWIGLAYSPKRPAQNTARKPTAAKTR